MKKIERSEILPIGEYEIIRERFRARVIQEKKPRRVRLSDILSVTFENRDTVLMQIQEMTRTERITSEDGIRHEMETYNELVPDDGELSLTLYVEIPDKAEREPKLVELVGLEDHVAIEIDGDRFPAMGKRPDDGMGRTTAVHYLKFRLSDKAKESLLSLKSDVRMTVNHPALAASVDLGPETKRSLAGDLR